MTTRPIRMIRESATEEGAAQAANNVASARAPKRTTKGAFIRWRNVAARAWVAGLPTGATEDGLLHLSH